MKKASPKNAAPCRSTHSSAYARLTRLLGQCGVSEGVHRFMRTPRFIISTAAPSAISRDTHASLCAQAYREWAYEGETERGLYPNEYVLRLHAGDMLSCDALLQLAIAVEQARYTAPDMLYADEGVFDGNSITHELKKCEYSRITALSYDIFGAPLAVNINIYYASAPPPHNADRYEEYAFKLRCAAKSRRIVHIPKPLLFSCKGEDNVPQAHKTAVEPHTGLIQADETVSPGLWQGSFIVRAKGQPRLVSIIIPNLNGGDSLRRLLESIERCCGTSGYEIIIADGGSADGRVLKYYSLLEQARAARIISCGTLGFSALSRAGAEAARGDALLFLNRAAELCEPNTLHALASQGERSDASAVGCTLISPQGSLLFAGGAVTCGGSISYPYSGISVDSVRSYQARRHVDTVRSVSIVSGACMYMRTDVYFSSGGFDESFDAPYFEPLLPTGADAELCIRLYRRSLHAVYTPETRVILHTPLASLAHASESVRIRLSDTLRRISINGDPYTGAQEQ